MLKLSFILLLGEKHEIGIRFAVSLSFVVHVVVVVLVLAAGDIL